MKQIILILFLFLTSNIFGQNLPLNIELTKDSDTTFWLNYHLKDIEKLNLIKPISDNNFLRISSSKYFLEILPNASKISFYAKEIWDNVQTGESFVKSYDLTSEQFNEIQSLYKSLQIQKIPSDNLIENWKHGVDGIEYIIELKNGNSYSFKSYWTPSAQKEFDESKKILEFTNQLDKIIDYPAKRKEFEKQIPFYGWTYNGSMVVIKIISNTKEYRKYKRIKEKQLKRKK